MVLELEGRIQSLGTDRNWAQYLSSQCNLSASAKTDRGGRPEGRGWGDLKEAWVGKLVSDRYWSWVLRDD